MSVIFWAGLTQVNSNCATAKVGAQTGEPGRPYDVVKYRAGAVGTAQQSGREVRSPALLG